jgi:predicted membrane metal-binding protein
VQAKRPQVFRDDGAFDRRAYLATQNIDLTATLRDPRLLECTSSARITPSTLLARTRRRLRDEVDLFFGGQPQIAGVLRAMLRGDRSFVERDEATDFQKIGVFHVLVVAGLQVGALTALSFWAGRKLRLSPTWTIFLVPTLKNARGRWPAGARARGEANFGGGVLAMLSPTLPGFFVSVDSRRLSVL